MFSVLSFNFISKTFVAAVVVVVVFFTFIRYFIFTS